MSKSHVVDASRPIGRFRAASAAELARHMDLSPERCGVLAARGVMVGAGAGKYDVDASRRSYLDHQRCGVASRLLDMPAGPVLIDLFTSLLLQEAGTLPVATRDAVVAVERATARLLKADTGGGV
jgi:hypothetical protein